MIREFFVEELKQLIEQEGCGDNCRSGIMPVSTALKDLRPSANTIETLGQRDAITQRTQS